jgi:hypothetical protein
MRRQSTPLSPSTIHRVTAATSCIADDGIARASLDADIVAALEPDHVDSLVNRLASAYYIPVLPFRNHDRFPECGQTTSSRIKLEGFEDEARAGRHG